MTFTENNLLSLRELGFSDKDLDLTVSSKYLLGGAPIPRGRLGVVLVHAAALIVKHAQIELSLMMVLRGGFAQPAGSLGGVRSLLLQE